MDRPDSKADVYEPHFRRHLQRRMRDVNVHRADALIEELREFFASAGPGLVQHAKLFPMLDLPQVHYGLRACFVNAREVFRVGKSGASSDLGIATERRIELRPGQFETFLVEGTSLCCMPNGRRIAFMFEEHTDSWQSSFKFSVIGPRSDDDSIKKEFGHLVDWIRHDHYLSRQAIRPNGTLLQLGDRVTWDDVALLQETRSSLEDNIVKVLQLRERFVAMGIPQKRGILLNGPPGTGKTMIGKVIANLQLATFILVTAGEIEGPGSIREAFELARRFCPTVLFVEDLDLIAVNRNGRCDVGVLGELLAQLDGIEENDGLIVVATTNDLSAIEPALADRPSRFDVVLEIGLPATAERHRILAKHIGSLVEATTLRHMAERTVGCSGAQVREVAYQIVQEVLLTEDGSEATLQKVCDPSIQRIFDRFADRKGKLGFAATRNVTERHQPM